MGNPASQSGRRATGRLGAAGGHPFWCGIGVDAGAEEAAGAPRGKKHEADEGVDNIRTA